MEKSGSVEKGLGEEAIGERTCWKAGLISFEKGLDEGAGWNTGYVAWCMSSVIKRPEEALLRVWVLENGA